MKKRHLIQFLFSFQLDIVTITGPHRNCEEAKKGLERRVQQLEAEKEERVRQLILILSLLGSHFLDVCNNLIIFVNNYNFVSLRFPSIL